MVPPLSDVSFIRFALAGLDQNYIAGIFIQKEWRSQGIGGEVAGFS